MRSIYLVQLMFEKEQGQILHEQPKLVPERSPESIVCNVFVAFLVFMGLWENCHPQVRSGRQHWLCWVVCACFWQPLRFERKIVWILVNAIR